VEVVEQCHIANAMTVIFREQKELNQISTLVIAGTDVVFTPIIYEANYEGCNTCVISFGNDIAKELADAADNIKLFSRSDILFQ
jgi:uncharacterized LabA/DUF88 family protein